MVGYMTEDHEREQEFLAVMFLLMIAIIIMCI